MSHAIGNVVKNDVNLFHHSVIKSPPSSVVHKNTFEVKNKLSWFVYTNIYIFALNSIISSV